MELKRSNFLLLISMGLILISFVSFILWGYQKYYVPESPAKSSAKDKESIAENDEKQQEVNSEKKDSSAIIAEKITAGTFPQIDSTPENPSTTAIYTNETDQELEAAQKKIEELTEKIRSMEKQNESTERERRKLEESIRSLSKSRSEKSSDNTNETAPADKSGKASGNSHHRNRPAYIGGIKLGAVYTKDGEDVKTSESSRAEKFSGTIYFKNASNPPSQVTELYLVVYGPDGKLLNSGWETGIFVTQKGKMNYTTKLGFDCNPEETKKINFSIYPDRFQKGNYVLYAYLNGKLAAYDYKYLR